MRGKPAPCTPESGRHGSPPRVRGKLEERLDLRQQLRITPARAGKTSSQGRLSRRGEDHPRACGENPDRLWAVLHEAGSPPRVRGKPNRAGITAVPQGITPARAGKTHSCAAAPPPAWDHPRACGENLIACAEKMDKKGSPPRVRGKRFCRSSARLYMRITPARAGKTFALSVSTLYSTDHPRACGENFIKHAQKGR